MVLPFFSDRKQAEEASVGKVGIVAMSGRRLFELTQGATLMLNPNPDRAALYPPEVSALLAEASPWIFHSGKAAAR